MSSAQQSLSVSDAPSSRHLGTRKRIIEAAAQCFERYSLRHTSMEEVAKLSGLSRQTIYRHFQNKDDLVAAVSEHKARGITEQVRARIRRGQTSREKIITAIVTCAENLVTDRQMRELVEGDYRELMSRAESAGVVAATTERWTPILCEAIADGTLPADTHIDQLISWITDIQLLLAMRVIVLGSALDEIEREVERYVMDGFCRR
jgi:AcrR family transcriptional regulator